MSKDQIEALATDLRWFGARIGPGHEVTIACLGWADRLDQIAARVDADMTRISRLRQAILDLPRYTEQDVARRPSTNEYLNAERVEELLAADIVGRLAIPDLMPDRRIEAMRQGVIPDRRTE